MEPRDLNRMFNALAPTPEQEQAGLDRLLQTERKVFPVKKLKKLTVIGIAAALMVISCAAAVVTGLDQRLIDYFGGGKQVEELLLPGAMSVDITAEDNGATLHATQVLRDRYSIAVLADFTVPEGTVLDVERFAGFSLDDEGILFLNSDGVPVNDNIADSYVFTCGWRLLEDGKPEDNHLSMLFYLTIPEGLRENLDVTALRVSTMNMAFINNGKVEWPYTATLIVFKTTSTWNEYTWPLIITTRKNMWTVQLALSVFKEEFITQWNYLMAATTLIMLPLLVMYVFMQKYFVEGIVTTGIKG